MKDNSREVALPLVDIGDKVLYEGKKAKVLDVQRKGKDQEAEIKFMPKDGKKETDWVDTKDLQRAATPQSLEEMKNQVGHPIASMCAQWSQEYTEDIAKKYDLYFDPVAARSDEDVSYRGRISDERVDALVKEVSKKFGVEFFPAMRSQMTPIAWMTDPKTLHGKYIRFYIAKWKTSTVQWDTRFLLHR